MISHRVDGARARGLLLRGCIVLAPWLVPATALAQGRTPSGAPEPVESGRCAPEVWGNAIGEAVARRPAAEIADLYKLLYQATRGSEHAVVDRAAAKTWLDDEIAALDEGPPEAIVDTLPGGAFARVHLRPYLAAGRSADALLEAFVETANDPGPPAGLACALEGLVRAARDGTVGRGPEDVERYLAARAAEGYPAVHHSAAYTRAYRPAYRVVSVGRLSALGRSDRGPDGPSGAGLRDR